MNEKRQLLPVGTIVTLKGSNRKLAVVTLLPVAEVNGVQGYFDFGAVTLPGGLSGQELIFFNVEDVEKLVFLGYVDVNFQRFVGRYDEIAADLGYEKLNVGSLKKEGNRSEDIYGGSAGETSAESQKTNGE